MCIQATGSIRVFLSLALLASGVALAGDEREFQRTVSASPKGEVEVSSVGGAIEVTGWDQPQIEVKASYDTDVERIDVTSERDRVVIKVVVPTAGRSRWGDADLKIRVPRGNEVEVTAVSAEVRVKGVTGEQRLKTVSGSITTDVATSDVETKTVSGNLMLRGTDQAASVRASSVSGDIRYERGNGDLEASTVSGDLSAVLQPGKDIRVRTTSGDINISGVLADGAAVEGESISGELTVHMKSEGGFRYEVNSFSGDIQNCFDREAERVSKYGPGSRLSGDRGKGRGEVRLKTLSGDVDLCDR
jgi:DUF4097 and DUF4098 domain-containing protein YvlB